jgi:hypothetical protein
MIYIPVEEICVKTLKFVRLFLFLLCFVLVFGCCKSFEVLVSMYVCIQSRFPPKEKESGFCTHIPSSTAIEIFFVRSKSQGDRAQHIVVGYHACLPHESNIYPARYSLKASYSSSLRIRRSRGGEKSLRQIATSVGHFDFLFVLYFS